MILALPVTLTGSLEMYALGVEGAGVGVTPAVGVRREFVGSDLGGRSLSCMVNDTGVMAVAVVVDTHAVIVSASGIRLEVRLALLFIVRHNRCNYRSGQSSCSQTVMLSLQGSGIR